MVHAGGSVTWTESQDEGGNLVGLTIDAVSGPVTLNGAAAVPGPVGVLGPPTNRDQCKSGGWASFTHPRTFRNQGDCIQYVNTGK